ncbi:hypothetical protein VB738_13580 [Cyanobium gracile UHCC 0139]|uniref:Uncharacterized protein n=1 Tax=Cyanobium gracile UHCC 0139 TaxID=3110308 RepID=A0ABU5RWY6_9CYAN|nr:hypothetical protein [Cyanobium gracile]MEA5392288.1 hypothetical protein [Cyanobium gracile UHCC 0139]
MSQPDPRPTDWRAVIAAHPLESHEPAAWLRYGVALSQLIEPSAQERQQQQQVGLAFAHAEALGASKEAVALSQRQATLLSLVEALALAGAEGAAAALEGLADGL